MESGEELPGSGSDEELDRWIEDLESGQYDDPPTADESEDQGLDRSGETGESTAKRPRREDPGPNEMRSARGGPPRNPDGTIPPPPPGFDENGFPIGSEVGEQFRREKEKKKRRKKPPARRTGRALCMPRPTEMTKAEWEQHRRE